MKKIKFTMIILLSMFVIAACSDKDTDNNTNEDPVDVENDNNENVGNENNEPDETGNDNENNDTNNAIGNDDENNDTNDEEGSNDLGIEEEDQLDLGIGDTAKVDSIHGVFELTLDSAEIIEDELDGEMSQLDDLILLGLTVKNTSDETLDVEDIMGNFEVTDSLDGTGFSDGADYFDSVEKLTGELEPGEELEGEFITDIYDKDEYYFRLRSGFSGSGQSNSVVFTFTAEEAK